MTPDASPPARARVRGRFRYDYTQGSIGWGITRLAVPSCAEQITWNVDTLVEIFWVGRLGPAYLAAVSVSFMAVFFLRAVGLGIRIAGSALVAQRVGAGDAEGASLAAAQAVLLAAAYSASISVLGFALAGPLARLLSSDPQVVSLAASYLRAAFVFFLFVDGIFTLAHLLRSAGEPGFSLAGMLVSTVVSVTSVPLFIFGAGPLPAFGVAGGAVGVGLGRLGGALVILAILSSGASRLHLRPAHFRPRADILGRLVGLGWPAAAQNLLERGANLVLVRMLSVFGAFTLAAWGIGNRVSTVARMPSFGIQAAVRTMVGQNVGAGRPERALRSVFYALAGLVLLMGAVSVGLYREAGRIVAFFGMEGEAARVGALCLRILTAGLVLESVRRTVAGAFQGSAHTKPPMVVEGAVRWGVQLPAAYLAGFPGGLAGAGVWGAIAGSHILGGALLFAWFLRWSGRGGLASHAEDPRPPAGPPGPAVYNAPPPSPRAKGAGEENP